MIIQCEQCQTKFRLDDSKVTDKGVKVRCAKCRHVFSVARQQPELEPVADFGALLDQSTADGPEDASNPFAQQEKDGAPDALPDTDAATSMDSWDEMFAETSQEAAGAFNMFEGESSPVDGEEAVLPAFGADAGFGPGQVEPQVEKEPASDSADGFSGFAFNDANPFADAETTPVFEAAPPSAVADDFTGFVFDDANPFADAAAAPVTEEVQPASGDTGCADFDFNSEDLFAATSVTEEPAKSEADEFQPGEATGTAMEEAESVAKEAEAASDEVSGLGGLITGAAATHEEGLPTGSGGSMSYPDLLFTPSAVAPEQPDTDAAEVALGREATVERAVSQEEMPPLSIPSRRRQSPFVTGAIAVAGVLAAAAIAFLGYSNFSEDKSKAVQDPERISVRTIEASFVKNPATGDLLLITGEALNNFKKPRAAIQVKGMVYGPNGQVVASKNAYAGNPLTRAQLATMPLDKIEAAMSNQFGDSLANLEVAPGKAIPFVIVIAQPPADAKDYGVEPAGSTVATGK